MAEDPHQQYIDRMHDEDRIIREARKWPIKTWVWVIIAMLICGGVGAFIYSELLEPPSASEQSLEGCRSYFDEIDSFIEKWDAANSDEARRRLLSDHWLTIERLYYNKFHYAEAEYQIPAFMSLVNSWLGNDTEEEFWTDILWEECTALVERKRQEAYDARDR